MGIRADELIVDSFAGGGGASTGITAALGRGPDIAINHDREAIAMHMANHPTTYHYCEDIWQVNPVAACAGHPVGLAWFSPDCTNHSRARAGKPRSQKIRSLAWVATRWAKAVRPRIIIVENVEEISKWGPLVDGQPDPKRLGKTFRAWLARFRKLGYQVEHRSLVAADYGAPTTRKRFYLIARCDGEPIIWPEKTHGRGCAQPWRSAAEIIDWSLPCPSIFGRAKPLAEATMRRIAEGIRRFVLESPTPFVVPVGDGVMAPSMVQTSYGERPGQRPRCLDLSKPLGTVVAGGQKHALVAAWLAKHYGGVVGQPLERPTATITAQDHHSLVTALLTKFYGTSTGQVVTQPLPTITGGGEHLGLVTVRGEEYRIVDIGLRMLAPHELYAAQGFPASYVIAPEVGGKPLTKTAQIRMVGNSVAPPVAEAIVRAQVEERALAAVA